MTLRKVWMGWGPGGNPDLEAAWFNDPLFSYWKQPEIAEGTPNAWEQFQESGLFFLNMEIELAQEKGQAIHLVLHSFGAQIFFAWLRKNSGFPFARVTLLASTVNLFKGYQVLGEGRGLKVFDASKPTLASFFDLFGKLTTDPDLLKSYWANSNSDAYRRYESLQATIPHLHFGTYLAVMGDLLKRCEAGEVWNLDQPIPEPRSEAIELHLGEKDPLIRLQEEMPLWKALFPNAKITSYPCGHFPHFEVGTLQIFNDKSA